MFSLYLGSAASFKQAWLDNQHKSNSRILITVSRSNAFRVTSADCRTSGFTLEALVMGAR